MREGLGLVLPKDLVPLLYGLNRHHALNKVVRVRVRVRARVRARVRVRVMG
jgi:hypothetical protein